VISPEWLTAIATIVLALVAFFTIFRDVLLQLIRKPKFLINFNSGQPDCHRVLLQQFGPQGQVLHAAETHYVRARVHNNGETGAHDVEVSVVEVRKKDAAGNFQRVPMGTPWNLVWAHIGSHVLPHLPVGSERHIDLGHVVDPQGRPGFAGEDKPGSDPLKTLFCLAFFVKSNTLEYLLDPGEEYQIDFQIFASNASPSPVFTFHLNHTGKWFFAESPMYSSGLGLRIEEA